MATTDPLAAVKAKYPCEEEEFVVPWELGGGVVYVLRVHTPFGEILFKREPLLEKYNAEQGTGI